MRLHGQFFTYLGSSGRLETEVVSDSSLLWTTEVHLRRVWDLINYPHTARSLTFTILSLPFLPRPLLLAAPPTALALLATDNRAVCPALLAHVGSPALLHRRAAVAAAVVVTWKPRVRPRLLTIESMASGR